MKKLIDPFTVYLPHLDLHGEVRDSVKFLVDTFVKDNHLLGKEKIVIIHGRSGGVLKKEVHLVLKNNELVKNFYIDSVNDGQTIVEL
jgi:DNA mismatch repair protein MutS2